MRDAGYTRRPTLREMAEPEQEPVAWCDIKEDGTIHGLRYWSEPGRREHALYTHPPRRAWRGLTEEEMFHVENNVPDSVISDRQWTVYFARAIEAKLKELNHD
jgi:hypothetical protein